MKEHTNHLVNPDDRMGIWKENWQTDPRHTKAITYGRKFTAIDAHYQIESMTKFFGPIGNGWGFERTLSVHNQEAVRLVEVERTLRHTMQIPHVVCDMRLWYRWRVGEELFEGEFQCVGCSELYSWSTKDMLWHFDEDSYKKAETDALTKGISRLGFNADVFLGMYDDQKYVAQLQRKFEENSKAAKATKPAETPPENPQALEPLPSTQFYVKPTAAHVKEANRIVGLNFESINANDIDYHAMTNALCAASGMGLDAAYIHMERAHGWKIGNKDIPAQYAGNLFRKCCGMYLRIKDMIAKIDRNDSLKLLNAIHKHSTSREFADLIDADKDFWEFIENQIEEDAQAFLNT